MHKSGIAIDRAVRNFASALLLASAFGVLLFLLRQSEWLIFTPSVGSALIAYCLITMLLGSAVLFVAGRLRVFSLEAFSG